MGTAYKLDEPIIAHLRQKKLYIVLLGGPGSGKGTQGQKLAEELQIAHVASGDLLREHLAQETPIGRAAQTYISCGELVPDGVVIAMIRERLERADTAKGVILDGFPRTVPQAKALDEILAAQARKLTLVADLKVSPETLLARLGGRWTCRECGAVYHVLYQPPRERGKCDICGGELYQRPDDRPEVQKRRIAVYFAQTLPVIAYYKERGLLVEIDGERDIAAVHTQLLAALEAA